MSARQRLSRVLQSSPLGPSFLRARARLAQPRSGALLAFTRFLGSLPSRRLRTLLAVRVLGMEIDPTAILYGWRDIREPSRVRIGAGSVIGFDATLDGREGITIGADVNLSSEVAMWTLQHDPSDPEFASRGGPIVVEDRAWISFRATILPGVTVGRGAVVAAGALVTEDVEEFAIVGGVPARVIGSRPRELRYDLTEDVPWFV